MGMYLFNVLQCVIAGFAGTYLYDVLDIVYEDLAVAYLTGVESLLCSFYHSFNRYLAYDYLDLYLRQQVSFDLDASVELCRALLHTAAKYVGHCHTSYADIGHSRLERFKLILLCNDNDLTHLCAVSRLCALVCNRYCSLNRSRAKLDSFDFLFLAAGGKFHVHCRNEVSIRGGQTVLCGIQTNDLLVAGYSQTDSLLDDKECERDGDACPRKDGHHTEKLNAKLIESAAIEQTYCVLACAVYCCNAAVLTMTVREKTYCDSAPDTVEEVNCNCTDRVVDVKLVIEKPYAEAYKEAGYKTDDSCAKAVGVSAGSGDSHQTCQRSVQAHGNIRLTVL